MSVDNYSGKYSWGKHFDSWVRTKCTLGWDEDCFMFPCLFVYVPIFTSHVRQATSLHYYTAIATSTEETTGSLQANRPRHVKLA